MTQTKAQATKAQAMKRYRERHPESLTKYRKTKLSETHQELALMALVASPTPEDACAFLKAEHGIQTTPAMLASMARYRSEQYEELRARIAPFKEKVLTHNLMDNALYASEVTKVSMEQLMERLEEGLIKPELLSRVARDVADVESKSIEKKLALEGRPGVITETRNAADVIRALEQKGVLVKQIEATVDETDSV